MSAANTMQYDSNTNQLTCEGNWDIKHVPDLQRLFEQTHWPTSGDININGGAIEQLDSAGAWLINTIINKLNKNGVSTHLEGFTKTHADLLAIIAKRISEEGVLPESKQPNFIVTLGKITTEGLIETRDYLSFIGYLSYETLRVAFKPAHIRWSSLASIIYRNGYLALPIIGLLSFMIGIVIAYQMGLQLKNYGANIYIVDLQGLAVLREFGPLLTAIMVAGRTGSAFTAQLGMMKINQEIDALDTMGVTPAELLLLPRIFGLIIALPLLTIWADIFGVAGGMVMANSLLSITPYDFLHRFPQVIPLRALLIGIGKAPVFALIISTIGCFEGMKVEGSADSVGRNTTRSVVLAIFFIIVADAAFSIIFSKLKL